MTNTELRQYFLENRNDETAFSQALEVLLGRKKYEFNYPPPQNMSYEEVEAIFKKKIDSQS
jgi:hypothetical protein